MASSVDNEITTSETTDDASELVGEEDQRTALPLGLGLNITTFYYGPMLRDPSAGEVPTTWTDQVSGVSVQNQLGVRYDFSNTVSLMPVFDFEVLVTDPAQIYGQQYLALTYDSFLKLTDTGLASFGLGPHSAYLSGDFRVYVPTSEFSRDNNTFGSIRLTLTPSLQLSGSRWSFSVVNFARYWVQSQQFDSLFGTYALPRLMLYTGPLVSYQASDRLSFWFLTEASVTFDTLGIPNTSAPNRSLVDIEPGLDFKLGNRITISPYLNWFVRQPLDTASMNVTASLAI